MVIDFLAFRLRQSWRVARDIGWLASVILFLLLPFLAISYSLQPVNGLTVTLTLCLVIIRLGIWHRMSRHSLSLYTGRIRPFISDCILVSTPFIVTLAYGAQYVYVATVLLIAILSVALISRTVAPLNIRLPKDLNIFGLSGSPDAVALNRRFLFVVLALYALTIALTLVTKSFIVSLIGMFGVLNIWLSIILKEEPMSVLLLHSNSGISSFILRRIADSTMNYVKLSSPLLVLSIATQAFNSDPQYAITIVVFLLLVSSVSLALLIKLSDINNRKRNVIVSGLALGVLLSIMIHPVIVIVMLFIWLWAGVSAYKKMKLIFRA
jgi:hypothetical protein